MSKDLNNVKDSDIKLEDVETLNGVCEWVKNKEGGFPNDVFNNISCKAIRRVKELLLRDIEAYEGEESLIVYKENYLPIIEEEGLETEILSTFLTIYNKCGDRQPNPINRIWYSLNCGIKEWYK